MTYVAVIVVERQQEDKFLIPDPLKLGLVFERHTTFVEFEKTTVKRPPALCSLHQFKMF